MTADDSGDDSQAQGEDGKDEADSDDLAEGASDDDEAGVDATAETIAELPATDDVLRRFAALGAQQAFEFDPALLGKFKVPEIDVAALLGSQKFDLDILLPSQLRESLRMSTSKFLASRLQDSYWQSANLTAKLLRDSLSVDALYSSAQLALAAAAGPSSEPRPSRTPEAFFGEHAVEIDSVKTLLKALSVVQSKHHEHRLVWRGQQNVAFEVHSSLYRKLARVELDVEGRLTQAEVETLSSAEIWGLRPRKALEFFAKLQHNGAPTRLLDSTVDPEIATWFAVEADPELDAVDGLVFGWGRAPRTKPMKPGSHEQIPESEAIPFWHAWTTNEERHRVGWGTGTRTWTWFPPALSDRMRAQRAGFLIEAGPILTEAVLSVFTDALSQDWRASEIARATSIVGLPSRHDVLTKPNTANLVPVFTFRILRTAKREIREYLEGKGLTYSTMYPDIGGLVQHLRGPYGPTRDRQSSHSQG